MASTPWNAVLTPEWIRTVAGVVIGVVLGVIVEPLKLWITGTRHLRRMRRAIYREFASCCEILGLLLPDPSKRAIDPRAFDLERLLAADAKEIEPYLSQRGLSETYFEQLRTPVYENLQMTDPATLANIPESPTLHRMYRMFEGLREPYITDRTEGKDKPELLRMKFYNAVKTLEYIERFMNEGGIEGSLLLKFRNLERKEKQDRIRTYTKYVRKRGM